MVSSSSVNNDLSSVKSILSSYSSQISGLDGAWKGTSHDSIVSKTESFISEYTSVIESGMSAFASACDKYENYKSYKNSLDIARNNLNLANQKQDSGAQSLYSNQVSEYTGKMNSLKAEIESLLSTVSSNRLAAASSTPNLNDFVNYYQYNYSDPYYAGTTIAEAGCGPTSMAMVLTYLTGKEVSPVEATNYSLNHGTYVNGQGTAWSYFEKISSDYGINCEESGVSSQNIVNSLSNGKTVIMSMGPGTFTRSGHFIVLTGINDDGTVSVADPNSEEHSNTNYDVSTFVNEGKEMWSFDK